MGIAADFARDAGASDAPSASSFASKFAAEAGAGADIPTSPAPTFPENKSGSAVDSLLNSGILKNIVGGLGRGAGSIGATLLAPIDMAARALNGGKPVNVGGYDIAGQDRRSAMDSALGSMGVDTNSMAYGGGKLAAEIAGTAGAGGLLANGARAILPAALQAAPAVAKVISGLSSGGFNLGGSPAATLGQQAANLAIRTGTGAAVGGASAGLVDPSMAATGAVIGGALPGVAQGLSALSGKVGSMIRGGPVSPEVADLANKAASLGINIPADRLTNSKPMNALASSLNYVPLSGRQAVEKGMQSDMNTALSRTVGQDSDNVTMALRNAHSDLGAKFDSVLQNNTVKVDPQFMSDLAESANKASRELGQDGASIIGKQVDDILSKAGTGEIDGQAAYNIKRTLDRIGQRNSPEAYYALDLKKSLMGALDRSLTPEESAAFATTRQQYGNMLSLQKLAQNGVDGDISIARLANMKNINNPELQTLADISAQFLKPREAIHGAAQRVGMLGAAGYAAGGVPGAVAATIPAMAIGRGTNALLNSDWARKALMSGPGPGLLSSGMESAAPLLYRSAGLLNSSQ